jgi:hypothetical protein
MIRDLVAQCPDRATESVIADWCEENGRAELAASLRSDGAGLRARAIGHLAATLADDAPLTRESFLAAVRYFEALDPTSRWIELARKLLLVRVPTHGGGPAIYFATRHELAPGPSLRTVRWALVKDLLRYPDAIPERHRDRVGELSELPRHACPACQKPALLVGEDAEWVDAARDPVYRTTLSALCLREPHVTKIADSNDWWHPASE